VGFLQELARRRVLAAGVSRTRGDAMRPRAASTERDAGRWMPTNRARWDPRGDDRHRRRVKSERRSGLRSVFCSSSLISSSSAIIHRFRRAIASTTAAATASVTTSSPTSAISGSTAAAAAAAARSLTFEFADAVVTHVA